MESSCSVFIATSLDGYIAREDGSIDWLEQANTSIPAGEDCGYGEFFTSVDALVMGRNTFEQVRSFEPWPYGDKRVVVMSSRNMEIPRALSATVSATAEPPVQVVMQLAAKGLHHLYIDGGKTIQSFLRAGLINELTITLIPVLLGAGRPLFGPLNNDVQLEHLATRSYDFGFVQNRYRVIKDE
jgi:dihydrofolate reductase